MEISSLADAIISYLQQEKSHLSSAEPDFWKRIALGVDEIGHRVGRSLHRTIISIILFLWIIFVIVFISVLVQGGANIDSQVVQWRGALIVIQVVIGALMILAVIAWHTGNVERGLQFAVFGFLLSLIALQTLYFYISQFSALTTTLIQFILLLILLAYRRWHLTEGK